jgi:hypothetical protein
MKKFRVSFRYKDEMSRGEWRKQSSNFYGENKDEAVNKCIEFYGLGVDCEYEITNVEEV